jgi:adenylate kinase family enzyme
VAGTPGSGKTTIARTIASRLGIPHYELDALHHGPAWTKRPSFEADVRAFSATDEWVTEDQYHRFIDDLLWARADTVVWLDLGRPVVMVRLVRRTVTRAVSRSELWNGNRETWRNWFSAGHPLPWTWVNFHARRRDIDDRVARHPHIKVVRLTTTREVKHWVQAELDQ